MRRLSIALTATAALAIASCGNDGPGVPPDDDAGDRRDAMPGDASAQDGAVPRDGGANDSCERPCTAKTPWRCEACLPVRTQEIAAIAHGGEIWVAGGFAPNATGAVHVFGGASGSWRPGPPLPAPRHHMMLASMDGDLYAVGGMETLAFDPVDTAWVLRDGEDEWRTIAPLPHRRAAGVIGAVDGRLVVAAGHTDGADGLEEGRRTLIYDPADDAWTDGALIPTAREHATGFVHDGALWVLGGRFLALEPTSPVVEIYDLDADEWRAGPSLQTGHGGFAATTLNGFAYVSGGELRRDVLVRVEVLDLARDAARWTDGPPLPTPRHGHGMVGLGDRIYAIGGADEPGFGAIDEVESFAP